MTESHSDAPSVFINNNLKRKKKKETMSIKRLLTNLNGKQQVQFVLRKDTIFKTLRIEQFTTLIFLDQCGGYTNLEMTKSHRTIHTHIQKK